MNMPYQKLLQSLGDAAHKLFALGHSCHVSEKLLSNVLPASIVEQLKSGKILIAEAYPDVSVVFADIVNFNELSATYPPETVVEILNELFSHFDDLTEKWGIEKIKTIGDAYMAVAGVPEHRSNHARVAAELALEMLDFVANYNKEQHARYDIRIGISSGPVVAGVIGKKKLSYDVWGETVNLASRMESEGEDNRIQVSESSYEYLKQDFFFEERDKRVKKGGERIKAYILTSRRS